MFELQNFIANNPSRLDLLNYKSKEKNIHKNYKISIYRNHSFELLENTINPFLDFAKLSVEFIYSNYDDSLSFFNIDLNSDIIILWLDCTRYKIDNFKAFIQERLDYLTSIYSGTVLFVPLGKNFNIKNNKVITYNLSEIETILGDKFLDERLEKYSGTRLSSKACIHISREIGLKYIPSILLPNLKAIILDLDNTLYKGVLGEDGINGIELTENHKKLQEHIVKLANQGFFICLASKNEEEDVIKMFNERTDFPLKLENITKYSIGWHSKAQSISEIAKFLNIGIDSMLFIDDNIGELLSVLNEHPNIHLIHAQDEADKTLFILENYPQLLKFKSSAEDKIRKNDIQANEQRRMLQESLSKEDYLKSLNIELTYGLNVLSQQQRISELANKTNQFICTYKRYSLVEVENLMKDNNYLIVTVSLKDKLSDSGIIGVSVYKNEPDYVNLEECFISCRALGRGIDDNIVLYPIEIALNHFNKKTFKVNFVKGERNKPAENFINDNLSAFIYSYSIYNKETDTKVVKTNIVKG